jgi:PTH1 family peptidyl-tRNA hydrolase
MKLIVGLGNPGRVYANNRHNVGFVCVNYFARMHGIRFDRKQGRARIGDGEVAGNKIVVAKPQTSMNLSGRSVSRLVEKFNINLNELIVIHDDLDLPLGKIRIRHGSSSGGHKGVDSIIDGLGSRDFLRIRIGIGRPTPTGNAVEIGEADTIAYVLGDFTPDEKQVIAPVIPQVSEAILCLLAEGLTAAMNKYN